MSRVTKLIGDQQIDHHQFPLQKLQTIQKCAFFLDSTPMLSGFRRASSLMFPIGLSVVIVANKYKPYGPPLY